MRLEYFQMIDRIVDIDVDSRRVRTQCTVPTESPIFEGHFPNYPLMPGVLLIECMAQTTGWLVCMLGRFSAMPFLAGVKEGKFRNLVFPGDTLEFEGTVVHEGSGYVWTDQYDWKIQVAGRPGYANVETEAVVGDLAAPRPRGAVLYGDSDGMLCGAVTVNWPRAIALCRQALSARATHTEALQTVTGARR